VAGSGDRKKPVPPGGNPGPGVDLYGQPVIDPTQNVLDLVEAAIRRQDDLRQLQTRYTHQIGEMRETHAQYVAELRAQFQKELRQAETARIDAIRAVDVGAVSRAAEVSAAQASTLAASQQASADALRGQVEQARIATADALAQALAPITKSIEDLRAAQYQQQGEKSSKVETSTSDRDAVLIEQARIQATQARMQLAGVLIAALVLAVALYAALHH
jgi:hypothetical protein